MRYSSTNYYNITPIDIEKVPKARIFNNILDEYIQKSCKRVLYRSMTRQDGYKNDEVAEIIDLNGNVKLQLNGRDGHIDIDETSTYYQLLENSPRLSLILVHNHPNNSSVSFRDLHSFIAEPTLIGVIAVSNNGCISYAIKTSKDINYYDILSWKISTRIPRRAENRISPSKIRTRMLKEPHKYNLLIGRSNRRK